MVLLLVIVVIAILYYATPNVKQPKFRWMSIGSLMALVIFLLASVAFGFYVGNFSSYNQTYGTIGGVIMIRCCGSGYCTCPCCSVPSSTPKTERGRQLQSGIEAEKTIQLPPRDTKQSDKIQAREEEDIRRGRELREQHADAAGRV